MDIRKFYWKFLVDILSLLFFDGYFLAKHYVTCILYGLLLLPLFTILLIVYFRHWYSILNVCSSGRVLSAFIRAEFLSMSRCILTDIVTWLQHCYNISWFLFGWFCFIMDFVYVTFSSQLHRVIVIILVSYFFSICFCKLSLVSYLVFVLAFALPLVITLVS